MSRNYSWTIAFVQIQSLQLDQIAYLALYRIWTWMNTIWRIFNFLCWVKSKTNIFGITGWKAQKRTLECQKSINSKYLQSKKPRTYSECNVVSDTGNTISELEITSRQFRLKISSSQEKKKIEISRSQHSTKKCTWKGHLGQWRQIHFRYSIVFKNQFQFTFRLFLPPPRPPRIGKVCSKWPPSSDIWSMIVVENWDSSKCQLWAHPEIKRLNKTVLFTETLYLCLPGLKRLMEHAPNGSSRR